MVPSPSGPRARRRTSTTRRSVVAVLLGVGLLFGATGCLEQESGMIDRINRHRASVGARALEPNLALWLKAGGWAIHMADAGRMSHSNIVEGNPYAWRALAENVAVGSSLDLVYNGWLGSGTHRNNIENRNFNFTAVGIVHRGDKYYVVQEFMQL